MRRAALTTVLDVCGVLFLAAFAFFVWPAAALLVLGAAALAISFSIERRADE